MARIYPAANIEAADRNHPIARGWKAFTLRDEPYTNNYFGAEDNGLLPGATADMSGVKVGERSDWAAIVTGLICERTFGGWPAKQGPYWAG